MSIDTTFKPLGPSIGVTTTPVQVSTTDGCGKTAVRVINTFTALQAFCWAPTAAQAAALAATLPATGVGLAAGVTSPNTVFMLPGSVEVFEIASNMFFCGNGSAAFMFLPGIGA
jgi:hypothetical protein